MKKSILFAYFFLTLTCFQYSCEHEEEIRGHKNFVVYKDVIKEYHIAEKLHITTHLDILKEPNELLVSGWSIPGSAKSHRWAIGEKSQIRFIAKKRNDILMRWHCWPIPSHDLQQTISIFLNAHFVSKITLSPAPKEYEIVLPRAYLQDEINDIVFKYAFAKKPSEIGESRDYRNLSVAFKYIEFEGDESLDARIELTEGKIRQPPNTYFNYYVLLPQNSYLSIDLNNTPDDLYGFVEISPDNFPSQVHKFDHGPHQIDLSSLANTFVKLSFWTDYEDNRTRKADSAESSYIEWGQIQLLTQTEEVAGSKHNQNKQRIADIQKDLSKYDVMYIVFDAFHAKHASLYGYSRKTTPFIDELAKDAIVFENMFTNAPYTLASTGTLFTSRYSHEHSLISETNRLSPIISTINELLSNAGIETYLITDHQFFREAWGLSRGFSTILSTIFEHESYSTHPEMVTEAIDKIYGGASQKRKFIYIHLMPPHSPYLPPKEFRIFLEPEIGFIEPTQENLDRIKTGKLQISEKQLEYIVSLYDANILFADYIARKIFTYLEDHDLLKNCIVVVTSDHGEAFMEHDKILHGSTVFDEMIHIPFFLHIPKETNIRPRRISHIASLIDVAPTLAELYHLESPASFSGKSLLPLITQNFSETSFIYSEALLPGVRTIRDLNYKYILSPERTMLFHISDDALERHNIIQKHQVIAGYYRQLMQTFLNPPLIDASLNKIDIHKMDNKTIQRLKGLGYLK